MQRTWRGSSSLATASWMMLSASVTVPCSRANCSSRSFCFSCSSWLDYMNAHRNTHWNRTYACLSFHRCCTDIQKLDCWCLYQNRRGEHTAAYLCPLLCFMCYTHHSLINQRGHSIKIILLHIIPAVFSPKRGSVKIVQSTFVQNKGKTVLRLLSTSSWW